MAQPNRNYNFKNSQLLNEFYFTLYNNLKFVKRTKSNFLFDLQYSIYRALDSAAWGARTIRIAITTPLPTATLLTTAQINDATTTFKYRGCDYVLPALG
jgi:hypothetical protein